MSSSTNQTDIGSQDDDDDVPVAMFVCLGVGGYLLLVIVIIVIYRSIKGQSTCKCQCNNWGSCCQFGGDKSRCRCESCGCCENCSISHCFSGLCANWKCCDGQSCTSCSGCYKSCNTGCPSCASCCSNCGSCITSCLPSCSCDGEGCVCMCLEIKLHKRDNQSKPYSDSRGTAGGGKVGIDDAGQLCSTHSPPQHYNHTQEELGKQQRYHQRQGFDGPVISDVTSVEGTPMDKDGHLSPRSIKMALTRESHSSSPGHSQNLHKAQVSFQSTYNEGLRPQRKLPIPGSEEEGGSIGTNTNKTLSNCSSADLSNSDSSNRLSSRIRRSLHAGRRSQRYPNKFLVNADANSTSKDDVSKTIHRASPRDVSLKTRDFENSDSTQSAWPSSRSSSGQQTTHLLSKISNGQTTKPMSSTSSSRVLPTPKGFQSL